MKIRGLSVCWGVASAIGGVTGQFQTRDHNFKADATIIKDAGDNTVSKAYNDFREEAIFSFIATDGSTGLSNAVVTLPTIGDFLTISDVRYPDIIGSDWLLDDIITQGSNESATKVIFKLSRYDNLTP